MNIETEDEMSKSGKSASGVGAQGVKDIPAEEKAEDLACTDDTCGTSQEDVQDSTGNARIVELETTVQELKAALEDVRDKALRREAEIDNYRKRLVRDKEDAVAYANSRLVEDLIPVLDDFERALTAADTATDVKVLRDGVSMVEQRLRTTLTKSWGLEEIDPQGEEFDPNFHEAYMMTESEDCDTEKVDQVFAKGYKIRDRVIRPAKVKVIKPKV